MITPLNINFYFVVSVIRPSHGKVIPGSDGNGGGDVDTCGTCVLLIDQSFDIHSPAGLGVDA